VSIGLAKDARGQGLGTSALKAIQGEGTRPSWATALYAVIRQENAASRRAFEEAGFAGPSAAAAALLGGGDGTGVWVLELDSSKRQAGTAVA
jgi:L-amino acid N-acyltransferase YncA